MNKEKLFTINFIVQAVIATASQIINLIQKVKTKKTEDNGNETPEL